MSPEASVIEPWQVLILYGGHRVAYGTVSILSAFYFHFHD